MWMAVCSERLVEALQAEHLARADHRLIAGLVSPGYLGVVEPIPERIRATEEVAGPDGGIRRDAAADSVESDHCL
jgi:hypothetical protein